MLGTPDRVHGAFARLPVKDRPRWRKAESGHKLRPADVHLNEALERVRVVAHVGWRELIGSDRRTPPASEQVIGSTIRFLTRVVALWAADWKAQRIQREAARAAEVVV